MYEPIVIVNIYDDLPDTRYFHHIDNALSFVERNFILCWDKDWLDDDFYRKDLDYWLKQLRETYAIENYGEIIFSAFGD